jgi:hypothetical protein
MKSFKEFVVIAEKAAIPMTPEQIAVGRARKAAAAQRLAQNATNPGERAAAAAASERTRAVPSENIRGTDQSSASGKPPSGTPPSQPSGGAPQARSNTRQPQNTSNWVKDRLKDLRRGPGSNPPPSGSYRSTGVGRVENTRNVTNPGRGPTPIQNVANNARNLKNFRPSSVPGLKSGAGIGAAVATADEKMKGSGWLRSLAKGATVAAGTALGGVTGGAVGSLGGPVGTAVGGYAGQAAGAAAADKSFDVVAGKNAAERAADIVKNRQRQAGGGLAGIGGKTTFSKDKDGTGFMSTGVGAQRKTVSLAKTSVVKDPKTGKLEAGNLAFKDGKAVYKRAAAPGEGTSNPFERIGRFVNPGAYKANDAKLAQQKLQAAVKSDVKRQQALGVKGSKNLVGAKIVGPAKSAVKLAGTTGEPPKNRRGGK